LGQEGSKGRGSHLISKGVVGGNREKAPGNFPRKFHYWGLQNSLSWQTSRGGRTYRRGRIKGGGKNLRSIDGGMNTEEKLGKSFQRAMRGMLCLTAPQLPPIVYGPGGGNELTCLLKKNFVLKLHFDLAATKKHKKVCCAGVRQKR